jgi:glycosyltransferase involved in cell wall biosynthesis
MNFSAREWPAHLHVCIPAYQSAGTLKQFLPALLNVVPASNVCVVDDGSVDDTREYSLSLGIRYVRHEANKGKGAALATGFASLLEQSAEAIITMDADGQHAVGDLPFFLNDFSEHSELGICIGCRKIKRGYMPFARICSNRLTSLILGLMTGVPILDSQSGYRLYSARFLRRITIGYPRFEMESEVLLKAANLGFPIRFVPIQTLYLGGASHISHLADTLRWVKAVVLVWVALRKSNIGKT